ncbi:SURF1 family protein [Litoreibacter roseus]|uniref:SURF1-like protein n=1 Tax=Litoreibacter roseus TaxID=2601869 RepID=A0A6N6JHI6_9RHOB|nr:SURF1 family protein [Litoreibacter roseus]GFE65300.1 SURF1-like protein [Litoreibacter roseus]
MLKRMIIPLLFGLGGIAILVSLGLWQIQRLAGKEAMLADIDARIVGDPTELPATADPERERYLPVAATGTITSDEVHVLVSVKRRGAGYRVISAFETDGRRVLLDRGFIPTDQKDASRPAVEAEIMGNLHWPDEIDSYTPEPDTTRDIWFARDVPALATALEAEPLLIVLRETSEMNSPVSPLPVDTSTIPNDHLQYAITWFSLAALWMGMTLYLLWRIRRRTI